MNDAPPLSRRALHFPTASWARRVLALMVDWLASTLVVSFFDGWHWAAGTDRSWLVLGVYLVESSAFMAVMGGSFGQLVTRLRVVDASGDPRPISPLRAVPRQILIALVIPPLIFRADGRGLHDIAAKTATVTLQTFNVLKAEAAA